MFGTPVLKFDVVFAYYVVAACMGAPYRVAVRLYLLGFSREMKTRKDYIKLIFY